MLKQHSVSSLDIKTSGYIFWGGLKWGGQVGRGEKSSINFSHAAFLGTKSVGYSSRFAILAN